jgi:hypothetical protein
MAKLYNDAEQFINDVYWEHTHDKRSKLDIAKIVSERLEKENKEHDPDYYNHREGVVHCSSLTKCLRGLVLEMLGAKKDKELDTRKLGVFKAGNLFEDFIIDSLGDRVIHKQREYVYKYKNLTLVGRSDYTINDDGIMRVGENKSVHSDSFWYREAEGTLVAWNNQVQLQIYMWLERELFGNQWEGVFSYVSKDDVTVIGAPVKFNPLIINEVVIPILDLINEAYTNKDPNLVPLPAMSVYNRARHQYQTNWIATYCDFHDQCAGKGWIIEAKDEVARRNRELRDNAPADLLAHLIKKDKPNIQPEK